MCLPAVACSSFHASCYSHCIRAVAFWSGMAAFSTAFDFASFSSPPSFRLTFLACLQSFVFSLVQDTGFVLSVLFLFSWVFIVYCCILCSCAVCSLSTVCALLVYLCRPSFLFWIYHCLSLCVLFFSDPFLFLLCDVPCFSPFFGFPSSLIFILFQVSFFVCFLLIFCIFLFILLLWVEPLCAVMFPFCSTSVSCVLFFLFVHYFFLLFSWLFFSWFSVPCVIFFASLFNGLCHFFFYSRLFLFLQNDLLSFLFEILPDVSSPVPVLRFSLNSFSSLPFLLLWLFFEWTFSHLRVGSTLLGLSCH